MPAERHEHYTVVGWDDDGEPIGELTGFTEVIREPEYLPSDYTSLLGLATFEQGVCQSCGYHESLMDPSQHHYEPATRVCPVCAGTARYERILDAADRQFDKQLGESSPPGTPRPADGRKLSMRMLTADQAEQRRRQQANAARRGLTGQPHAAPRRQLRRLGGVLPGS